MNTTVIDKLNGSNYASWSFQIKLVLMDCDLWSTVQPGEIQPSESETENLRLFTSRRDKALAKMCLSIGNEQQQHIQHLTSPKEVWEELQKLYAPKDSKFRILQLRKQLYSEALIKHNGMDSYLGKINQIVNDLANVGDKVDDGDLAMILLCGLPEDWDSVISVICNLPESEFTSAVVKRRLLAEAERRISSLKVNIGNMAVHASPSILKNKRLANRANIICYNCGGKGHYARECLKKYKPKYENRNGKPITKQGIHMSAVCDTLTGINSDTWIVDSGATHHMTPNKEYFSSFKENPTDPNMITIADGSTIPIKGIGTVDAKIIGHFGGEDSFIANNALFAPNIKHSILSVSQLIENKKKVLFDAGGCRILDKDGKFLFEAKKIDRIFLIKAIPSKFEFPICNDNQINSAECKSNKLPLDVWHIRMMHVNNDEISKMIKNRSVKGLDCQFTKLDECDNCLMGKSSRQPFHDYSKRGSIGGIKPLDLVHCDLMGPFEIESWGRARYVLTIIDDASRFVNVFFLRNKGEVLEKFIAWKIRSEKQTQMFLKRIRTDNGLEFCSKAWDTFCRINGILHERTMIYTPQQNGVAERMNRTLMDLVRSTMCHSGLPKASWAELTYSAAYVRNRVTNSHNEMNTPYELWFKRKPSLRHFRSLGCEVFVHIPGQKRKSKLDARAQKGYLVGYAMEGHGWRIWMPHLKQVVESRDCVFKERTFYKSECRENRIKSSVKFFNDEMTDPKEIFRESSQSHVDRTDEIVSDLSESRKTTVQRNGSKSNNKENTSEINEKSEISLKTHPMTLRSHKTQEKIVNVESVNEAQINISKIDYQNPTSYCDAMECPEAEKWLEAISEEVESLRAHNVWELEELPKGVTPISCKWVFQKKTDSSGQVVRYKARLVAKGFTQRRGLDYDEVYAPVSSFETTRILTALGVEQNWFLDQYDVKSAYLYGELNQVIFMEQPEGIVKPGEGHLYCRLKRSIYGLKQSGKCWNEYLDERLRKVGFKRNPIDPCVYDLDHREGKIILSIYVDDILAITENEIVREKCKQILNDCFEMRYIGQVSYLLGVKFMKDEDGNITLTQEAYIDSLLERFGVQEGKEIATPMETKLESLENEDTEPCNHLPYRELIGGLLYLAHRTRPDIAYSVGRLAQYCTHYTKEHWRAAKRVLSYLKSTKTLGIMYKCTGEQLIAYSDADWATGSRDRRSTTGYFVMLAGAPVVWKSSKQSITALSTMEAEYISLSSSVREVTWIREFLNQLNMSHFASEPINVWCDNQAAIAHSKNYIDKSRTRHIAIRHHFIREKVVDKTVDVKYIPSGENVADIMTKPLNRNLFELHRSRLLVKRSD